MLQLSNLRFRPNVDLGPCLSYICYNLSMTKLDKLFLSIILYPVSPILFFLTFWWISLSYVQDGYTFLIGLTGICIGILIDIFFVKKYISKGYDLNNISLILIYLFYSICIFGFFMGVPVFNIFLGIPAGIYISRKIYYKNIKEKEKTIFTTCIFTSIAMLFICISSAYIALLSTSTISDLTGMFNLQFTLTPLMLRTGILIGGVCLVVLQYFVTKISSKKLSTF